MGNPVSKIREEAKEEAAENRREIEQRIQILEKMVTAHLNNEKTKIFQGVRGDEEIHSGTVVSEHQQVNLVETKKPSQSLEDAISDFFSGDLIGGLKDIVELGAKAVLGNASMGEYETSDMFIVWSENALLRCDAYYYRWNFVSNGVIDQTEGAVGVYVVKRVIDMTKTDPQVLTWAITNTASRTNPPVDSNKLIDDALKVLEKVAVFQAKLKQIEAGASGAQMPEE